MNRSTLSDPEWYTLLTFLRTCSGLYIGEESECRRFVEAVLWIARSGAQWRLLPATYGRWNTVYKRFARWCKQGVWEQLLTQASRDSDLEWIILDSTMRRAHPCAAGASQKTVGKPVRP
ncbi:MAG TPA: transposase [Anaerolineae bacterium]|nr:transposase [Anaerolineae bacterium]